MERKAVKPAKVKGVYAIEGMPFLCVIKSDGEGAADPVFKHGCVFGLRKHTIELEKHGDAQRVCFGSLNGTCLKDKNKHTPPKNDYCCFPLEALDDAIMIRKSSRSKTAKKIIDEYMKCELRPSCIGFGRIKFLDTTGSIVAVK